MHDKKDKLDILIELAPLAGDDEVALFNNIDAFKVIKKQLIKSPIGLIV